MVFGDIRVGLLLRHTKVERLLQSNHIEVEESEQMLAQDVLCEISEAEVDEIVEQLDQEAAALRLQMTK